MKLRLADTVFSKWIKKRDFYTCQRCGKVHLEKSQGLHCAHFKGRRAESTRFYPDNFQSLCYGCHSYFHQNPKEHELFVIGWLGMPLYEKLILRHRQHVKRDDKAVVSYYRNLLSTKLEE
jgi:hypothetical protein